MKSNLSTLQLHLKRAGYSITKPRQDVFDLLTKEAPLTMHSLWKKLADTTDRATIYRTVALFEKLGIVQRISMGWKYTLELTDEFVPHHHHFTCVSCHRVISFDEPVALGNMLDSIASHDGFLVKNHTLEIEGYCSNCLDKAH